MFRQAARLLKVSQRTIYEMHVTGRMPPPIRVGRAVRWSAEALTKWVEVGCPIEPGWQLEGGGRTGQSG